ncbi:hypothetical protein AB4Y45_34150 [Paraburkholderia sp. EG287A]|uniref:hypothetical protein n=1 Tax=Paraburkholderia sp. EG287A TaxID=3237012 RepID=UPI0034D2A3E7
MDEAKRVANNALGQQLIDDMRRTFGQVFQLFKPLAPGALIRHQDGGLYRFVGYARGTEDTGLRMLYNHVWPFDATDIPWDRPAVEWASRFTPITEQDLVEAMKQDRTQAQQAVIDAKAARRAAAAGLVSKPAE